MPLSSGLMASFDAVVMLVSLYSSKSRRPLSAALLSTLHIAVVANGWLYIDGGSVSYENSNGDIEYTTSKTLALHLTSSQY